MISLGHFAAASLSEHSSWFTLTHFGLKQHLYDGRQESLTQSITISRRFASTRSLTFKRPLQITKSKQSRRQWRKRQEVQVEQKQIAQR